MATKVWLGTTSSDVTVSTNWSPANQPVALDDVIITGNVAITGAVLATGNLSSLTIRDYTGAIGSESSPLVVDLDTDSTVSIDTTGKAYLDFNASIVDIDVIQTSTTTGTARGLHLSGSGARTVNAYGSSSVLITETLDNDINTFGAQTKVTLAAGATAVNFTGSGELVCYGNLTNIYASGSDVNYYGDALTTAEAEGGAAIYHRSAANITNANAHGGRISGEDTNATATITNTSVRDGGEILPGRNWTITNNPTTPYKLSS